MKTFLLYLACFILGAAIGYTVMGCAGLPPAQAAHPTTLPTVAAPPLAAVAVSLNHLIVLSVIAVGIGVALFFILPAAHATSLSIVEVAGGIELSALITRQSLHYVPYLVYGLAGLAVLFFLYELYINRSSVEAAASTVEGDVSAGATKAKTAIGHLVSRIYPNVVTGVDKLAADVKTEIKKL